MRTEKNRLALAGASRNAEAAFNVATSPDYAHFREDERSAWAMAAIIHCDVCRLFVAFAECELEGIARLLWLGDIASKLYEARNWYNKSGTNTLRLIAQRKPIDLKTVNARIDALKKTHAIHRVNRYLEYRNKLGYHYDAIAIAHLQSFGQTDGDEFFAVLKSFIKFSGEWAQLTKDVIGSPEVASKDGEPGS